MVSGKPLCCRLEECTSHYIYYITPLCVFLFLSTCLNFLPVCPFLVLFSMLHRMRDRVIWIAYFLITHILKAFAMSPGKKPPKNKKKTINPYSTDSSPPPLVCIPPLQIKSDKVTSDLFQGWMSVLERAREMKPPGLTETALLGLPSSLSTAWSSSDSSDPTSITEDELIQVLAAVLRMPTYAHAVLTEMQQVAIGDIIAEYATTPSLSPTSLFLYFVYWGAPNLTGVHRTRHDGGRDTSLTATRGVLEPRYLCHFMLTCPILMIHRIPKKISRSHGQHRDQGRTAGAGNCLLARSVHVWHFRCDCSSQYGRGC